MNKTNLTELKVGRLTDVVCEVAPGITKLAKTNIEESKKTEREFLEKQGEVLKNDKLTTEEKKYYFDENNKTYLISKTIDYLGIIGFATAISSGLYLVVRDSGLIKPMD